MTLKFKQTEAFSYSEYVLNFSKYISNIKQNIYDIKIILRGEEPLHGISCHCQRCSSMSEKEDKILFNFSILNNLEKLPQIESLVLKKYKYVFGIVTDCKSCCKTKVYVR